MKNGGGNNGDFPKTRWSLVFRANGDDEEASREALEELCRIYWQPLYIFARGKGLKPTDAEDVTQDFISDFIHHDDFRKVNSDGKRLRSYLLKSLDNFMISDWRKQQRKKRGGDQVKVSFDNLRAEEQFEYLRSDRDNPETLYDRVWAITLLESTINGLEEIYSKSGKKDLFAALRPGLTSTDSLPPYQELARKLGMTVANIKINVHRVRREFGRALRRAVGDTIAPEDDIDEEIRALMKILAS